MKIHTYIKIFLIVLLAVVAFLPIYNPLYYRFTARETYYSHGFLVPLLSLYLIFRKREDLKRIKPSSCGWGLVVLLGGLALLLVSVLLRVNVTAYFSLPLVISGIVLYLLGARFTRAIWFPLAFLFFMLPLPEVFIIGATFKLKLIAAQASTFLINCMGIKAVQQGSTIYYPGGHLLVGAPCSGLRSLISFLALGAVFTQFVNATTVKKHFLFLSTVPIALLTNLLRLTFLVLVGYVYGEQVATGFLHDASGMVVFGLGFVFLIGITKVLKCPLTLETT